MNDKFAREDETPYAQEFLDDCQYFLAFFTIDEEFMHFVHFIAYLDRPSEKDLIHAYEELGTDETFGLIDIHDSLQHVVYDRKFMQETFPDVLCVEQTTH